MQNETSSYNTPENDTTKKGTASTDLTDSGKPKNETPAEELAWLKKELEKKEADQAKTGQDIKRLKDEITELGKAVAEIEKKAKDWDAASKKIKEQQAAQRTYFDSEKKELEATLSADDKKVVTDAKEKGETEVNQTLTNRVNTLTETVAKKKDALAKAEAAKAAAEQKYKNEVNLAETGNTSLKELTTIHTDAESEEKKNNTMREYFLILEGEDVLGKIDVPDVPTYLARLNKAGAAAADAADVERAAKDEVDKAQVELQKAQKDLSEARKNRRQKTLASIPENGPAKTQG